MEYTQSSSKFREELFDYDRDAPPHVSERARRQHASSMVLFKYRTEAQINQGRSASQRLARLKETA